MFRDISLGFESFQNNFEPVEQSSSYNPPLCKFLCDNVQDYCSPSRFSRENSQLLQVYEGSMYVLFTT